MLAFVQLWLDDYSEDFRDPPLHRPLRLLLDHLRISSAVHDHMRSQPNFCSLAGQAEGLLQRFQREGDVPPVWLKLWLTLRPVTMLTSTDSTCVSGQELSQSCVTFRRTWVDQRVLLMEGQEARTCSVSWTSPPQTSPLS